MSGTTLFSQFDDRNPAFNYGPGWSNLTDANAHDSTLSYTSDKATATIQFYGKSMWLFGVIEKTQNGDQPVYRYTLDGRYTFTTVADVKYDTAYNQLLAHFYDLDPSYHMLIVENINEGATLFLDYYLVEPIPPNEVPKPTESFQTGAEPLRTSISQRPMLNVTPGSTGNSRIGLIVGTVVAGVVGLILIATVLFVFWKRRKCAKPYYYQSATVYEVLSDEFESDKNKLKRDPVASSVTSCPSYPSSVHPSSGDRAPTSLKAYFPLPSEYKSQNLLPMSDSACSRSSSHLGSRSSPNPPDDSSSHEQRPLL